MRQPQLLLIRMLKPLLSPKRAQRCSPQPLLPTLQARLRPQSQPCQQPRLVAPALLVLVLVLAA